LVKLATEPPDLAGLPAELDGIVTACLARSPGQRPTSAALLGQLGPFVATPAGPRSAHAYLPAPAMAVIGGAPQRPPPARRPAPGRGGRRPGPPAAAPRGRTARARGGTPPGAAPGPPAAAPARAGTRRRSALRGRSRRRPPPGARLSAPGPPGRSRETRPPR